MRRVGLFLASVLRLGTRKEKKIIKKEEREEPRRSRRPNEKTRTELRFSAGTPELSGRVANRGEKLESAEDGG